jgi:hypothetical protein
MRLQPLRIAKSILYFVLAGLCEIGGGYLVWLWLREGKSIWLGAVGAVVLVSLWSHPDTATCKPRTGLCVLRRRLRRPFCFVELES